MKVESQRMAENQLRIVKESAELCNTTKKPEVFFSRFDLLVKGGKKLAALSKYVKFKGTPPEIALNQILEEKPEATKALIMRCLEDSEGVKTTSARIKRYQKLLFDFISYKDKIETENWTYLEEKCVSEINNAAESERSGKTKKMMSLISAINEHAAKANELMNWSYDLTVNYYYTDPNKTKLEQQPLTNTGKEPKYPMRFYYDGINEQGISNFGDVWLLKDGSIGKAEMTKWFDKKGVMIHLAIIDGVLAVKKIEIAEASYNWQTVYKA